jgi:hypothetical protein
MTGVRSAIHTAEKLRLRARTQIACDGVRVILKLTGRVTALSGFDALIEALLDELASGIEVPRLRSLMIDRFGEECAPRVDEVVERLDAGGFLERGEPPQHLALADLDRFSRLVDFFSEFEDDTTSRYDLLARMREATVAVLGTGGMGSWVVYNLLCIGVGGLVLIDGDVVEPSNLNRSILYSEDVVGRPKTEAARDAVLRFAPRTRVTTHQTYIDGPERLAPLLDGVDLLLCCADQPLWRIREWSAAAGRATRVPVLNVTGAQVGPFYLPGESSCQMCDWASQVRRNPRLPEMLELKRRLPRGTSGSLSPIATMAAGPAMLDVFRYLSGYARPTTRDAVLEMSTEHGPRRRPQPPSADCPVCHGEASFTPTGASKEKSDGVQ